MIVPSECAVCTQDFKFISSNFILELLKYGFFFPCSTKCVLPRMASKQFLANFKVSVPVVLGVFGWRKWASFCIPVLKGINWLTVTEVRWRHHWPCVLFWNVQPSCDGKLLLFGYYADDNSYNGTCKGRVFWGGLWEEWTLVWFLILIWGI